MIVRIYRLRWSIDRENSHCDRNLQIAMTTWEFDHNLQIV